MIGTTRPSRPSAPRTPAVLLASVAGVLALAGVVHGTPTPTPAPTPAADRGPQPALQDPECMVAPQMDLEGRASPLDSATVELDGAVAKICYGAPSARGRTMIGGDDVPYGEFWRLGANEPTALHLTFPARLDGVELEPGVYSLYAVPGAEEWRIFVSQAVERWGIPIDDDVRAREVGDFRVARERPEDHVETLRIDFEEPAADAVRMVLEWEHYRIPMTLERVDR